LATVNDNSEPTQPPHIVHAWVGEVSGVNSCVPAYFG